MGGRRFLSGNGLSEQDRSVAFSFPPEVDPILSDWSSEALSKELNQRETVRT